MRRIAFALLLVSLSAFCASAQTPALDTIGSSDGGSASASNGAEVRHAIPALPLFFEGNKDQTDPRVRFLTRSSGYTLFLTPTETVLAESKTQMGESGGWGDVTPEIRSTAGSFVRMQLVGANPSPVMRGLEELPGKVNYLIGQDSSQWQTGVSLFSKVQTEQVYPGVDLLFHGDDRQLEYDFIVAPGADPSKIAFRIRGAARIEIDAHGDLVLHTSDSDFRMHKPVIYQAVGSERRVIEGSFIKKAKHEVAFRIGPYDHTHALVIDPSISYASFLGGAGVDTGNDVALDTTTAGAPKMYVPGVTNDITSFPETSQKVGVSGGFIYTFLAKIDPTQTGAASLVYLTFLGGSKSTTSGVACTTVHGRIGLDFSQGNANIEPVMVGQTNCTDFPVTSGSLTIGGTDNYVTRLMPSGAAPDVSVFFGGNGIQGGGWVDVDAQGDVLLVAGTTSTDLPATPAAYATLLNDDQGGFADCFAAKFNRALTVIDYMTYFNIGASSTGNNQVGCGGVFGPSGEILAGGNTPTATAFANAPAGTGGFQTTFEGTEDTFAIVLDPSKNGVNQLTFWTFIGGGGSTTADYGAIPLGAGVAAIVGNTTSSLASNPPDFPVNNCFQNTNLASSTSNKGTGFLVVVDTNQTGAASLICGTYFGGSGGDDKVQSVGFDPVGGSSLYRILLGGQTSSSDFPLSANALQSSLVGSQNGFVSVLTIPSVPGAAAPTPPFGTLSFSTYIGGGATASGESETVAGVAADPNHNIYARARTLSANFFGNTTPATTVNGFQTTCTSCGAATPADDVAIFVISSLPGATLQSIAVTPASPSIAQKGTQQFTATGTYNDGTIKDLTATAAWASSDTTIATIDAAGLATGVKAGGPVTITAKQAATGISGTATLNVTAAMLVSIAVTPSPANVAAGQTLQFTATGTFSDNSMQNLTNSVVWSSSDTTVATISNTAGAQGLATGVKAGGPVTITAKQGNISGTATLNVTAAVLVSIAATPSPASVGAGQTLQFTATGTFSDNSTQNLTNSVAWSSSDTTVATISNTSGTQGLATGVKAGGPVTITATLGNISGTTQLTVTAVLVSIGVTPANSSVAAGLTVQFTATGTFSDKSTQNLTNSVVWSSSDTTVGTINAAGLATGVKAGGPVAIKATQGAVAGQTNLTVTAAVLVSVAVTPNPGNVAPGNTLQFTATGTFTDKSTQNLTNSVVWSSSDTTVATINAAGLATGVKTGGPVTITAKQGNISGQAILNVTGGVANLSATTLTFPGQLLNSTSSPQALTLKNTGTGPLQITSIATSGDFAETNTCGSLPALVAVNASCTINVTFTPTAAGTRSGTLTISDSAPNSPQTIGLSGAGAVVALVPAPGSGTSATVNPGDSAIFPLVLNTNGFTGMVALSCVSQQPTITCSISPGTVTANGSTPVQTAIVVNTFCAWLAPRLAPPPSGGSGPQMLWALGMLAVALLGIGAANRQRRLGTALAGLALLAMLDAGCASLRHGPQGRTPPGTFILTITATPSSGASTSINVTLNVT